MVPEKWFPQNGLNPRPLSHETFALTTRPRLLINTDLSLQVALVTSGLGSQDKGGASFVRQTKVRRDVSEHRRLSAST
jgi:hypothetical protein